MRSTSYRFIGFVVGVLALCTTGQAETSALAPDADSYVRAGTAYENQNFGASTQLVVKDLTDPAYKRASFLRFNLAGLAGTPTRVVLKLNCVELTQGAATVEVYAIDDDSWAETGITWVNQPTRGVLLASVSVGATGTVSLELSAFALHELAGDGVLSICLAQPANQNRYVVFASREATAGQPALEITTPDEPEVATVAPNADTYVRAGAGNEITNYGTASGLAIKDVSDAQYKRISFLRFAIPPASQAYSKASLRLHCMNLPQGAGTIEAWLVEDDSWSETGMTWLDAPARKSLIASQVVPTLGTLCEIDLTSVVQQAQGGDGIVSIALVQPANQDRLVEFASREAEMGRPTLGLSLPSVADTTSPQITTTTPAAGGTIAPLAPSVSIAFSEAMDCTSVETAFSMGNLGGSFSWSGNTVTFKPMPPLEEGTSFAVTVGTGAKDLAGNGLAAPYVFTVNTSLIPGLVGEYFNEMDLTSRALVRIDPNINFSWGGNSPDPLIEPETYSARWTGLVKSDVGGLHTFTASVDNGVRAWIGGQLIIDDWRDIPPHDVSGSFNMVAGQWYPIIVEHFENWGGASIKLSWQRTGMSRTIIPTSAFRIPTDTQPPSMPASIAASLLSDRTVILQWPASADDTIVARYDVYRDGRFIGWTCEPTYRDTNLTPETGYSYQVQASDVVGKRSSLSVPLEMTTKAAPTPGDGTGLLAKLYDGMDFGTRKVVRVDPQVASNWGSSAPAAGVSKDAFSIRWDGQVQPLYSETYRFYTVSDDGIRLWVNGQIVVDHWTDHSQAEKSGEIALKAGEKYDIRVDYYEHSGQAVAKVFWESPSQPKELVPQSQLYPAEWLGGTEIKLLTSMESPVSPAWVEGKCSEDAASIRFAVNGDAPTYAVRENQAKWYADRSAGVSAAQPHGISLDQDNPTALSLTVSDNVNSQTYDYSLIWTPTKLNDKSWSKDEIVIRVNDSLLFTADDTKTKDAKDDGLKNGLVKIDCDGDGKTDCHGAPDEKFVWKYKKPGCFTATLWVRGKECGTMTVTVVDVDLHSPTACQIGYRREKFVEVFPLDGRNLVEFRGNDPSLIGVSNAGPAEDDGVDGVMLEVAVVTRGSPTLQARLNGPSGPLIRQSVVDEFTMSNTAKDLLMAKPEEGGGTVGVATLVMDPLVVYPDRPAKNPIAVLRLSSPGTTFDGGVTEMAVSTSEFILAEDGTGRFQYNIHLAPGNMSFCSVLDFWQVGSKPRKITYDDNANGYYILFNVHEKAFCENHNTASCALMDIEVKNGPSYPVVGRMFKLWLERVPTAEKKESSFQSDPSSLNVPPHDPNKWRDVTGPFGSAGHCMSELFLQPHVPDVSEPGESYDEKNHAPKAVDAGGSQTDKPFVVLSGTGTTNGGLPTGSTGLPKGTYTLYIESLNEYTAQLDFPEAVIVFQADLDAYRVQHNVADGELDEEREEDPGAFLPLNNDDDDYDKQPDMTTASACAEETDLLPIIIHPVDPNVGGTYTLEFPKCVRVWEKKDRSGSVSGTKAFDASKSTPLFVEGIDTKSDLIKLNWQAADGLYKGSKCDDCDRVKTTVYGWAGPLNVPGHAKYLYTSDPPTSVSRWDYPTGGVLVDEPGPSTTILWDGGPDIGHAIYAVNEDFVWDLEVNVVEIRIGRRSNVLIQNPPLQPFAKNPLIQAFKVDGAMTANVFVDLVDGPMRGGKRRGISSMIFGFIQNGTVTARNCTATVGAGPGAVVLRRTNAMEGNTYVDSRNSSYVPWVDRNEKLLKILTSDTVQRNVALTMLDTPRVNGVDQLAAPWMLTAGGLSGRVDHFSINIEFLVYLAVGTRDAVNGSETVFTQRAVRPWAFNGSGRITAETWTSDGINNSGTGPMEEVTSGDRVPVTEKPTMLDANRTAGWITR